MPNRARQLGTHESHVERSKQETIDWYRDQARTLTREGVKNEWVTRLLLAATLLSGEVVGADQSSSAAMAVVIPLAHLRALRQGR